MIIFFSLPRHRFTDDSEAKGDSSDHPSEQDSVKPVGSCAESDYECEESSSEQDSVKPVGSCAESDYECEELLT